MFKSLPGLLVLASAIVLAVAQRSGEGNVEIPMCIYSMNQSEATWCHSDPSLRNKNDSPFIHPEDGGDCLPHFGFWLKGRRWVPVGEISWKPIKKPLPISHAELAPIFVKKDDDDETDEEEEREMGTGFEVIGYFKSSCSGYHGIDCAEFGGQCDFQEGVDDSLLLKMSIWGEIDCNDPVVQRRFHSCPKDMTGCMDIPNSKFYEFLQGYFIFANGRRFWMEHRFQGAKKPAGPINVGPGANLHNSRLGVGFWFQAHAYDNNEFLDGDFNVDLEPCFMPEIPEPEIPFCSVLNIDDGEEMTEDTGLCAYEHNSGGNLSNHMLQLSKEKRRMLPEFNNVMTITKEVVAKSNEDQRNPTGHKVTGLHPAYSSKHASVMIERALKVVSYKGGIDGEISFKGSIFDMGNEDYKLDVWLKASRSRFIFSCKEDGTGQKENDRREPYHCPNPAQPNQISVQQ